jgi:hypothetical protein
MDTGNSLISGLDAFAEQFRAQADSAGLPASEHAIHFCLALGLQAAWALPAGAIVFERTSRGGTRTDLWVGGPYDLAIEVKYLRSHPSGSQPARPMHYGQLLADFNKVTQVPGRLRLIATLCWTSSIRGCSLFAWEVTPGTGPSQTATGQRG